ncbi:MAG TPA: tagaturonate reductase [Puia sp.]|jgi:tagaturonate reductase|nr:tagaturonate reductase [Puia sp.]
MTLSEQSLQLLSKKNNAPGINYFQLPEKVLQFGTGVLLRALPDYFIDEANKQNIFNGRIVVVKSTTYGSADAFGGQNGLYTICVKGIEQEKIIDETYINASISRVLSATTEWEKILQCAISNDLEIIISNTTEVGITLLDNDNIFANPPSSFPGKLLSLLYKRFVFYEGNIQKGLVIIPTELIPDNASKLKNILITLSKQNKLSDEFIDWLNKHNDLCSSLVDRIVPGKLNAADKISIENKMGYEDELMIMAEPYRLWAIETGSETVKKKLSFSQCDEGVIIAPDITKFRELKLRLLNGTHTLNCGLAVLAGFETVKDAMQNTYFKNFVKQLMLGEIAASVVNEQITIDDAIQFGNNVIDRFSNPFIEHLWLNITLQYTSKMLMRNVPILKKHYQQTDNVPECIALGFSGYILFMKSKKNAEGKFIGNNGISGYIINDDMAAILNEKWNGKNIHAIVSDILGDENLWSMDLNSFPGFNEAVTKNIELLMKNGVKETMQKLLSKKEADQ